MAYTEENVSSFTYTCKTRDDLKKSQRFGENRNHLKAFRFKLVFKMKLELAALGLICLWQRKRKTKRSRIRKCWVKNWLLRRNELGVGLTLFNELASEEPSDFRNWMRMDEDDYSELLQLVQPFIQKTNTNMRESICTRQRLAVTLRYLATGETRKSLHYTFRISDKAISLIIHETARAIYESLQPKYLVTPTNAEAWKRIATSFWEKWQFPNCIGSLDGNHIRIMKPPESVPGSELHNYKGYFSVVLLGMVNSDYHFVYVDVGTNGRVIDGGVWGKSNLRAAIEQNSLDIPRAFPFPGTQIKAPFVTIADEAFGLKEYLLRPFAGRSLQYDERIYNYRLSRARRVVENAFGILSNRWRFLHTTINVASVDRVSNLVMAACCLHNYLCRRTSSRMTYIPENLVDHEDQTGNLVLGSWRQDFDCSTYERPDFGRVRSSLTAKNIQQMFKNYLNNEGAVSWRNERV